MMDDRVKEAKVTPQPGSVESLEIGGQQALRCVLAPGPAGDRTNYYVWIRTEGTAVQFWVQINPWEFPVFRWNFDPVLATAKVP